MHGVPSYRRVHVYNVDIIMLISSRVLYVKCTIFRQGIYYCLGTKSMAWNADIETT